MYRILSLIDLVTVNYVIMEGRLNKEIHACSYMYVHVHVHVCDTLSGKDNYFNDTVHIHM